MMDGAALTGLHVLQVDRFEVLRAGHPADLRVAEDLDVFLGLNPAGEVARHAPGKVLIRNIDLESLRVIPLTPFARKWDRSPRVKPRDRGSADPRRPEGLRETRCLVFQGPHEFVIDFMLRMAMPHQIVARVVLPPSNR